jgi:hypothetical protein
VLSVAVAARVSAAKDQRNLADCKIGRETCDYAQLTVLETKGLARTEHQRNYRACLNGHGYCDRSRLTPTEAGYLLNRLLGSTKGVPADHRLTGGKSEISIERAREFKAADHSKIICLRNNDVR